VVTPALLKHSAETWGGGGGPTITTNVGYLSNTDVSTTWVNMNAGGDAAGGSNGIMDLTIVSSHYVSGSFDRRITTSHIKINLNTKAYVRTYATIAQDLLTTGAGITSASGDGIEEGTITSSASVMHSFTDDALFSVNLEMRYSGAYQLQFSNANYTQATTRITWSNFAWS